MYLFFYFLIALLSLTFYLYSTLNFLKLMTKIKSNFKLLV